MGAPVRVGDLLADKYEVTRILGQGGMGVVVAARHRDLDKLVALKFMHEEVAANETAIDRFLREAKAAARLQNEHVGRVLDVGRLHNGVPYIVMEYLEGRDLADVAAHAGGALPVADVCEYMLQTCEAMAEAHAAGIIHRDLKPQNLFLTMRPDGRPLVKVLDFGISKIQASAGPTATQQTMGTPAYMSPEQMRSAKSCDGRADIWSLGVILYQLLGGTLPFAGDTIAETMLKVMTDSYLPLPQVRPGLPPALVAAVDRCLRKSRDERFDNVAELAHELTPFAPERARAAMSLIERVMSAGASQSVRPIAQDSFSNIVPSATTEPPSGPPRATPPAQQTTLGGAASAMSFDRPRSSPVKWIAMSAVAIAAAVAITVFSVRDDGTAASSPASAPPDAALTEPPRSSAAGIKQTETPVETKPVETKPVETKPVETKPVETKPVEIKPETKPDVIATPDPTTKPHPKVKTRPVAKLPRPEKPGGGSATATNATPPAPGGSATTPSTNGSAAPLSGDAAGSGSATKKPLRPVGEDKKPLRPVGG